MFVTHRKKHSVNCLNFTQNQESIINESLADSTATKRFHRTKNGTQENVRPRKLSRASDSCNEEDRKQSKDIPKVSKMPKFIFKPQELFLKISDTPSKNGSFYQPATSDRTTQVSYFPQYAERQEQFMNNESTLGKEMLTEFREELQLKNGEVLLLEDQVMRLRKTLVSKEEDYSTQCKKKAIEHQNEISRFKQQIATLKADLQEKNNVIKEQKKIESSLNREIKSLKYEKMMLEKQLEEIYKRKLPKEWHEIMSYRQKSLMVQVQALKQQLEESKSHREAQLQQQVQRLKQQSIFKANSLNTLNIHSHILNKKLSQKEMHIKQKAENFGRCYSTLRQSHTQVLSQLKVVRKQNIKLRRMQAVKSKLVQSSSEQSLTFSLASNN